MRHAKCQGHKLICSGVEDFFLFFFTIYGHGCQFGHVTRTVLHFCFLNLGDYAIDLVT